MCFCPTESLGGCCNFDFQAACIDCAARATSAQAPVFRLQGFGSESLIARIDIQSRNL